MKHYFKYKWGLLLALLIGNVTTTFAQEVEFKRSEYIYNLFVAGQGDSIHANLRKDLQEKLTPAIFNDTFEKTEKQMGKLKSKGKWRKNTAQGITIYYRDLEFEQYNLRFLLSFEEDARLNTIHLIPVPEASTAEKVKYDKRKMMERDIMVGVDGFKLPGTLTLPKSVTAAGKNKAPVVVLVHGSGPNDRDETYGPNKPFRDLAWGLAERGIGVIRYDKRTKVYGAAYIPVGREADFDVETVDDVVAIVAWAKEQSEIVADSIYVLGHSLGGTLAPRIAERTNGLAGIIILAGLARPLEDAVVDQIVYLTSQTDASEASKEKVDEVKKQAANLKKMGTDGYDDKIPLLLGLPRSYWLFANTYKPVKVAAELKLPILVLQGERDYQVTMEDFGLWRFGLLRNRNAFFKSYPKLNHLLQEGSGRSTPFEYNQGAPVPAYVMDDIVGFVRN